jgi:hypothetical protein
MKAFQILSVAAIMLAAVSCGGNSGKSTNPSENADVTTPDIKGVEYANLVKHVCDGGTFFLAVVRGQPHYDTSKGYLVVTPGTIKYAEALYDASGNLLFRFNGGVLLNWAGNTGIRKNGDRYSLFSFKTMKTKPIGKGARFIKDGWFVLSLASEYPNKQFWNQNGELVWEGKANNVYFDADMSKGFWVIINVYGELQKWLNLENGQLYPAEDSKNPPIVEEYDCTAGDEEYVD